MSKSRKRKQSDSLEEVERLRLYVRKIEEDLRAKDEALRARDDEVKHLRRERDCLSGEVDMLHKASIVDMTLTMAPPARRHVHDLPDKLLIRIFDLLDRTYLADVVCCVCIRWCNLVGEPSLWANAILAYGNSKGLHTGAVAFMRTLAAAPVLHALECGLSPADPPAVIQQLERCTTAASHLCFDLDTAAPDAVLRLLWNSRSTLKEFCLREGPLAQSDFSYSQACRFWEALEDAPQLRSLVLFLSQTSGLSSCLYSFRPCARPSLRTLALDVGIVDENTMWTQLGVVATNIATTLITAHRSTLEDVRLPMRGVCSPGAIKALSRCPQLRTARVPVSLEVHHLAKCKRLNDLHLTTDHMRRALNTDRLLHSIGQLRQLLVLTVSPLGKTGDAHAVANGLLAALDELVELRRLKLTSLPASEALERLAASPAAAPHLELLHFGQSCGDAAEGDCRLPALRRLLQVRRQLHVSMCSMKVRAEEPRCSQDHCRLAAANPVLPVAFVNHEDDAGCLTCAGFVHKLNGTILYLPQDGEFLDGDLPWRSASDLSVSSTPAGRPDEGLLMIKAAESDAEQDALGLCESLAQEPMGPPLKKRILSGPVKSSKPKVSSVKPKGRPKGSTKSKATPRPALRKAQKPSQRKPAGPRHAVHIPAIPALEWKTNLEVHKFDLSTPQTVSPQPSSEVKQLSPPPIEESVLLSKFPDMILHPVGDGKKDCLVKVILPSSHPPGPTGTSTQALTVQTCTSTTPAPSTALPSSTVSSTMPPIQANKLSSTAVDPSSSSLPDSVQPTNPSSKRKTQPKKKKTPAPRKGKTVKDKEETKLNAVSLVVPDINVLPATPSNSPLVSSTLPSGISRLPSFDPGAASPEGPAAADVKPEPCADEQPPTPSGETPPCASPRLPGAGVVEDDFSACISSPRRNQMRACRPMQPLTDANDALDHFVSTSRKVAFASSSAPRPRAPKMPSTTKCRKSAPAVATFTDDAYRLCITPVCNGIQDRPVAPPEGPSGAPSSAAKSIDAPLTASCENSSDALYDDISEPSPSSSPFSGFSPDTHTLVEVPSDSFKENAVAEFDVETVMTAESPTPKMKVLEVLRSAPPDGLVEVVKIELSADALNNNSNNCSSTWCGNGNSTDPTWAQPVTVKRAEIFADYDDHDMV